MLKLVMILVSVVNMMFGVYYGAVAGEYAQGAYNLSFATFLWVQQMDMA